MHLQAGLSVKAGQPLGLLLYALFFLAHLILHISIPLWNKAAAFESIPRIGHLEIGDLANMRRKLLLVPAAD
jgi:hypothetical protein